MFTTAIIAFREFFEAFLIVGMFLGVSKKLKLHKELEILLAAGAGIVISILLSGLTYIFGDSVTKVITEKNADIVESYLLIFSGFFIAYVVFSLHGMISRDKKELISKTANKLEKELFDITLFFTIMFMVVREGFEIAIFTASVSLFSTFLQNLAGFLVGFASSLMISFVTFTAYVKLSIKKIFQITQYLIMVIGASLVELGITKLLYTHLNVNLSHLGSFHFGFLPSVDTVTGHIIQGLFGIDREFSLARFSIMVAYVTITYMIFIRKNKRIV